MVEVVDVEVLVEVGGGVGSGDPGLDSSRSMRLAGAIGLGEQVAVPGPVALNVRLWLPSGPVYGRSAVQPDVVFALSVPVNVPPVSRGFTAPPSSPVTVPVVPFPMMKTPVTRYLFSPGIGSALAVSPAPASGADTGIVVIN
jgi:hypothetical protein